MPDSTDLRRLGMTAGVVAAALVAIGFWPGSTGAVDERGPLAFEVASTQVHLRPAINTTPVHVEVRGSASRRLDRLGFGWCGPDPMLAAVDGSTVEVERTGDTVWLQLHQPLRKGQTFTVMVLTSTTHDVSVPRGDGGLPTLPGLPAELFC